jgi:predicted DNA binding protein
MTILAVISIDAESFALGEVLSNGGTDTRIELTQFVPTNGDLIPYFWVVHSDGQETYERHVRADPRVERLTNLDGGVDRTLYRIEWTDGLDGFLDALRDNAVLVEEARGAPDEWRFRLRADTQQALSGFQEDCFEAGVPLDIQRVMHNSVPTGPSKYEITDKQGVALELAFEEGYFHVPRGTSQTELAEQIGISRQAFSRRLNRALETLIDSTYMMELNRKQRFNAETVGSG